MADIKFRCSDKLNEKITAESERLGLSKSRIVERVLSQFFGETPKKMKKETNAEFEKLQKSINEMNEKLEVIIMEIMDSYRNTGTSYEDSKYRETMIEKVREIIKQMDFISKRVKKDFPKGKGKEEKE